MSAAITPELRWHAVGRRKVGVARVYLTPGSGKWNINGRTLGDYFPRASLVSHIQQPFTATDTLGAFDVRAIASGGGQTGQAGALRLAIARALCLADERHRKKLREQGLLTRDPRAVERKKPGRAGVHFGHQTRRWNPKMRRFIFAERSGIYIIDLQKTLRQIEAAQELLRGVVLKGEGVLFVCTKKQLKNILQAEAERCGAFYVTERWLGGTLTNFQTIKKQIKRLKDLEQGISEGEFEHHTKKEQLLFNRERLKLEKYLSGIKAEAEGDKKKKPARRKRRPKPEAIAARLKTEEAPAPAESSGGGEG